MSIAGTEAALFPPQHSLILLHFMAIMMMTMVMMMRRRRTGLMLIVKQLHFTAPLSSPASGKQLPTTDAVKAAFVVSSPGFQNRKTNMERKVKDIHGDFSKLKTDKNRQETTKCCFIIWKLWTLAIIPKL